MKVDRITGRDMIGPGVRVGVAVSRTNDFVTERLLAGATGFLDRAGVAEVVVLDVAGAFELVAGAKALIDSGAAGVVALGALVRGDTPHFDYIAGAVSNGLAYLAAERCPVTFGVLTCDTLAQAVERAGGALGNKGEEAAAALVRILSARLELPGF